MVTINLGNSAGNTASASYTLSEGCSDSIINGMIPSVEWMTAIASNGTISITATEDNPTTSERSGYITPLINGESCTNNRFKVTQAAGEEPGPEPPTECTCLVDNCAEPDNLHTSNLDATGETTCDSAWAQNPYNYEWSVEYATSSSGPWTPSGSGWLTPSIGPKSLCVSGPTGQANYTATANDGAVRWARVHWTWKNETKEEGMCNDSYAYFKQLSSEPAEPCDVKLTLAGLEGTDKATIAWGDGSTDTNVGNEQTTHTYQDGEGHSATITADGYKTVTVNLDCNDEVTKTMEKSAGGCDCSSAGFSVTGKTDIEPGTNVTVATYTANCTDGASVVYKSGDNFLEGGCRFENGNIIAGKVNTHTEDYTGVYAVEINGEQCGEQFMIKSPKGCQYPGQAIQIMLTNVNTYQYYYLTNEIIGTNCSTWVETSGHKYLKSSAPLSLGYYQYDGCTMTGYDVGENYYCNISTPGTTACNGSNMPLQANKTYYLYGYDGTSFTQVRTIVMPDGETAQSGADINKYYEV